MTPQRSGAARFFGIMATVTVGLAGCADGGPELLQESSVPPASSSGSSGEAPGPDNTGVPDDVELQASDSITVRTDGIIIENLDISGCVVIAADDVTIRNTRIRCASPETANAVQVTAGHKGFVLEDSEIDGLGQAEIGVGWGSYTLRRVDIHDTADGARMGGNVLIEDSWIHDMERIGSLHGDALQSTEGENITVRNNTLDPRDTEDDDQNNAAIMLGSETGIKVLRNVVIEGNHLDGGNYSLNVRADANLDGVVVRDNIFGSNTRYGPVLAPTRLPIPPSNVLESTGESVDPDPAD